MENNTKILTIVGAGNTGKTNIAFKIAKELENRDNQVCIVNYDTLSPLATIKDNYEEYNVSIGYLLTKETGLTQTDIYTSMIPYTDNISFISYIYGDTKDRYSKIISNKVNDFLSLLKGMVDYIIIDAGSNIVKNEIKTSMQIADKILCVCEPNYKNIAYKKTFDLLLDRIDVKEEKITYLMNKIIYDENYIININKTRIKYYMELPYLKEIFINTNKPLKKLEKRIHETEKYKRNFKALMQSLYKIEYDNLSNENSNVDITYIKKDDTQLEKSIDIEDKINELKNENTDKKEEKTKKSIFNIFNKKENETKIKTNNYYIDDGGEF